MLSSCAGGGGELQEAQRDTISAFEEYMDACMMSDWAAEKKALFDSALPDTALPGPASQLAAASITAPYSPPQFRSALPAAGMHQPSFCQQDAALSLLWPQQQHWPLHSMLHAL